MSSSGALSRPKPLNLQFVLQSIPAKDQNQLERDKDSDDSDFAIKCATYYLSLNRILSSNIVGMTHGVYLGIPEIGCFELASSPSFFLAAKQLEKAIAKVLAGERALDEHTGIEVCAKVDNVQYFVGRRCFSLRRIGVVSGPAHPNVTSIKDYIDAITDSNKTYVFVIGDFQGTEIGDYVDDLVTASSTVSLPCHICVRNLCDELERKCDLF